MKDKQLAQEIIYRLNLLIEDPDIKQVMCRLIKRRIQVHDSKTMSKLGRHPTIQVSNYGAYSTVGFLGMLNGIVGVILDGEHKNRGWVTAVMTDDQQELINFQLTPE